MRKLIEAPASKLARSSFRNPAGRNRLQPGIRILPSRDAYGRILETWETRRTAERNHQDLTESYCRPSYLPPSLPGHPLTPGTASRSGSPFHPPGFAVQTAHQLLYQDSSRLATVFRSFSLPLQPPVDDAPPFHSITGGRRTSVRRVPHSQPAFPLTDFHYCNKMLPAWQPLRRFFSFLPASQSEPLFLVSNRFDAPAGPRFQPSPCIP